MDRQDDTMTIGGATIIIDTSEDPFSITGKDPFTGQQDYNVGKFSDIKHFLLF